MGSEKVITLTADELNLLTGVVLDDDAQGALEFCRNIKSKADKIGANMCKGD